MSGLFPSTLSLSLRSAARERPQGSNGEKRAPSLDARLEERSQVKREGLKGSCSYPCRRCPPSQSMLPSGRSIRPRTTSRLCEYGGLVGGNGRLGRMPREFLTTLVAPGSHSEAPAIPRRRHGRVQTKKRSNNRNTSATESSPQFTESRATIGSPTYSCRQC